MCVFVYAGERWRDKTALCGRVRDGGGYKMLALLGVAVMATGVAAAGKIRVTSYFGSGECNVSASGRACSNCEL